MFVEMMLCAGLLLIVTATALSRLLPAPRRRITPLERLQQRYAAGELSTEAYEAARTRLSES